MELGIFQETKVTDGIYTCRLAGYSVNATDALRRHCSGVALFHHPALHFVVEAVHKFGPDVVGFQLATGERRWYIVGCYLSPYDTLTINSAIAALKKYPRGAKPLVAGDFNVNLAEPEGDRRGEDIAAVMEMEGLEDMSARFLPRRCSW